MSKIVIENLQSNGILASLSQADAQLLLPDLEEVALRFRMQVQVPFHTIPYVYFLQSGIASVVATSKRKDRMAEAGLAGFEGMTGIPVILGTDRAPCNVNIQIAGRGMRIGSDQLRLAMFESRTLSAALHHFAHVFAVQTEQTSLANAKGTIPERLARWLLMIDDRTEGDYLTLTHDLISLMVGTRRAGITTALGDLCARGVIDNVRGTITIIDRDALETIADGLYGIPEDEYRRLFH